MMRSNTITNRNAAWVSYDSCFICHFNVLLEFEGDIFKFCLRKCQCQVKLGQIRSNFNIKNCLTKSCRSCLDLPQDPKNVVDFYAQQLKATKIAFLIEC